jgi:ParB/RepB/Spo0J family partition protein
MESVALTEIAAYDLKEIYVPDNDGRLEKQEIAELAESMKTGLINPVTLRERPKKQGRFELVAGRRRLAAAKLLGWNSIPAIVRPLTDLETATVRLVENDQRQDVHPLDQAEGYRDLMNIGNLSPGAIGQRIGRSENHVVDRLRLLSLIPAAAKLFRTGRIGIGHAIILARQKPADQERAISPDESPGHFSLFRSETRDVFEDGEEESKDPLYGYVARTVEEFQDWVDHHIRLDTKAAELPQLFPATAANLIQADEKELKVVPITHEYHVAQEARDAKTRTFGPMSWKRADGSDKESKTCEHSAMGILVVGRGRGESFTVCVDKSCPVHWKTEAKAARKRASAGASGNKAREAKLNLEREKKAAAEEAERSRWEKVEPDLIEALAIALKEAPATPSSYIGKMLIEAHASNLKNLSPGKSAESLVRYLAFHALSDSLNPWRAPRDFPKIAAALGIPYKKIMDTLAPVKAPQPEPAEKKPAKKAKR